MVPDSGRGGLDLACVDRRHQLGAVGLGLRSVGNGEVGHPVPVPVRLATAEVGRNGERVAAAGVDPGQTASAGEREASEVRSDRVVAGITFAGSRDQTAL